MEVTLLDFHNKADQEPEVNNVMFSVFDLILVTSRCVVLKVNNCFDLNHSWDQVEKLKGDILGGKLYFLAAFTAHKQHCNMDGKIQF